MISIAMYTKHESVIISYNKKVIVHVLLTRTARKTKI